MSPRAGLFALLCGQREAVDLGYSLRDEALDQMCMENPDRMRGTFDAREIKAWAHARFPTNPRQMLDYKVLLPYSARQGVNVAVDGLVDMPPPLSTLKGAKKSMFGSSGAALQTYKASFFLSPPALYKQAPVPLTEDAHFTRSHDPASSAQHPRFTDGFAPFRSVPHNPRTVLVLEVRPVTRTKSDGETRVEEPSLGYWGVLPFFEHAQQQQRQQQRAECGAVNNRLATIPTIASGCYLVPLFKGEVPAELINHTKLPGGMDAYEWICTNVATGKKPEPGQVVSAGLAAAVVRIADPQLDPDKVGLARPWRDAMLALAGEANPKPPPLLSYHARRVWALEPNAKLKSTAKRDRVLQVLQAPDDERKSIRRAASALQGSKGQEPVAEVLKGLNKSYAAASGISRYIF